MPQFWSKFMKQLFGLVGCITILMAIAGCQQPAVNRSSLRPAANKSGVEVTIDGGGKFPSFLVGRWKDKESGWEFVFEPDGKISFVRMNIQKDLRPGQITTAEIAGGVATLEPGPWTVHYSPDSRELTVIITLKNAYFEIGDELTESDGIDVFTGPVWPNGDIWQADWTTFPHDIIRTPDRPYVEFDMDDSNGLTTPLTFEKIAPK
jgi:hypothetical protein